MLNLVVRFLHSNNKATSASLKSGFADLPLTTIVTSQQPDWSVAMMVLEQHQSWCSRNDTNTVISIFNPIIFLCVEKKVRGKSLGFILWGSWMSVQNVLAIHPITIKLPSNEEEEVKKLVAVSFSQHLVSGGRAARVWKRCWESLFCVFALCSLYRRDWQNCQSAQKSKRVTCTPAGQKRTHAALIMRPYCEDISRCSLKTTEPSASSKSRANEQRQLSALPRKNCFFFTPPTVRDL